MPGIGSSEPPIGTKEDSTWPKNLDMGGAKIGFYVNGENEYRSFRSKNLRKNEIN